MTIDQFDKVYKRAARRGFLNGLMTAFVLLILGALIHVASLNF